MIHVSSHALARQCFQSVNLRGRISPQPVTIGLLTNLNDQRSMICAVTRYDATSVQTGQSVPNINRRAPNSSSAASRYWWMCFSSNAPSASLASVTMPDNLQTTCGSSASGVTSRSHASNCRLRMSGLPEMIEYQPMAIQRAAKLRHERQLVRGDEEFVDHRMLLQAARRHVESPRSQRGRRPRDRSAGHDETLSAVSRRANARGVGTIARRPDRPSRSRAAIHGCVAASSSRKSVSALIVRA